jgi:octaprenyl-diphosphate synthase
MYHDAFQPIVQDMEKARALFCAFRTPPIQQFQCIAEELHRRPGKWMRPGLFLLSVKAAGDITAKHHAVAAALEMVHNASLLHDDVLDDASIRRHAESAKALCGNRAAVLFGDLLLAGAFHLVSEAGLPEAYKMLSKIVQALCHGEALQDCLGGTPEKITPENALTVAERKTASFTQCACRCGHLLGNGSAAAADALGEYGRCLGIAYQIIDDILDIVGDEKIEGKTLGTDLVENRPTLPLALIIQRARDEALALIAEKDVSSLADLVRHSGVIADATAEASRRLDEGAAHLDNAANISPNALNGLRPNFQLILDALRRKLDTINR